MPRVTDKPSVTVTFIKGEDAPDTIKAVIQITSKQININPVDNGEKQIYQRTAFHPVQPPDDGLVLAFKKKFFGVEAIKLAGGQRVLREIHEKLSDPAKAPKPVKHISPKEIIMPNDDVVDKLKATIEKLPKYPGMLSHRSLLYSYIYLEGCNRKPQNLTLQSKKALTSLCKKRMGRAYGQPCGKEQKRYTDYIVKNIKIAQKAAAEAAEKREMAQNARRRHQRPGGMEFPDHVNPSMFRSRPQNPRDISLGDPFGRGDRNEARGGGEDQNMDDEPGGGDSDAMTDEAAHAAEELENVEMAEDSEDYEDTKRSEQFDMGIDLNNPLVALPDNFGLDNLALDAERMDNEVLEEQGQQAPVMRQRPQKHAAPKKDMEKLKQMKKHFLSESSSEESGEFTITRPTKQRTLSVSSSDDGSPTKLTAKRQHPLPPPPPLPKRRKAPVDNNNAGEVLEKQKKQKSGPVEEARTGVNDAAKDSDTAFTLSNDVIQQLMDEIGVSETGMEPSGEGEVLVGAFNDYHAEEGVVETEHANGVQNMPENGEEEVHGEDEQQKNEKKEGNVLSLLNDPIVCVDNKQRHVVEKINVALDNTFHMLVSLNNREAVAMEVGRLLKTGFQAAVEDARIEGFPPEEGFGPMLIDLFRIYSTYFFIPPLPNHCLAGCKKDGIVEELADAAAIEAHVMTPSHLSRIRRKMVHEGEFLDKKAKLFKISVQKLEDAEDIMSKMTFAPAVGLAEKLIEQVQLSIVTILKILGILFQKPAPLMPPSHIMQPCFQCSKCDDVFPSHLYDEHLLTPKHLRLTRSTIVINLEADEENQVEGKDATPSPMAGMKKEEVIDPGYGNPHRTIDVVDLTADE